MSSVFRSNRKTFDADIIRLNSIGMSLATIGRQLNCHPTTITTRLHSLRICPTDTRRSFMEDILVSLTPDQQEWLVNQLNAGTHIKDYVKTLIIDRYTRSESQRITHVREK